MKVLSLFDGISGAQLALSKAGLNVSEYYASEIDDYAVEITMKNFPKTIQLGDAANWHKWQLPDIDLLIGGSPCQGLSIANSNRQGLSDERSALFWVYVEILNSLKPRYFVLENVASMKTKDFTVISNTLGVKPVLLDAGRISAQRRRRYFWTNIPNIKQPVPKNLVIADILEKDVKRKQVIIDPKRIIKTSYGVRWNTGDTGVQSQKAVDMNKQGFTIDAGIGRKYPYRIVTSFNGLQGRQAIDTNNKFPPLDAQIGKRPAAIVEHNSQQNRAFAVNCQHGTLAASRTSSKTIFVFDDVRIEKLTWTEIERLAGLPDGYTDLGARNNSEKRGRGIGNGFQVDIVAHLLSHLKGLPEALRRNTGLTVPVQKCLFDSDDWAKSKGF